MTQITDKAKRLQRLEFPYGYSICTLVSNKDQYNKMLESFVKAGFAEEKCEYLYLDNTGGNSFDAFGAFNIFLQQARGKYIIICHQDIELIFDTKTELEQRIEEIDKIDPKWALLGNSGNINLKYKSQIITHGNPPVEDRRGRFFPQKVQTLDENFIVIKHEANLAVSSDLSGFHFYGTDVCLIAKVLGYNSYVINFHLYHNSTGNIDVNYHKIKKSLQRKYQKAFKGRYIQTVTGAKLYISGNRFVNLVFNTSIARIIARQYFKIRLLLSGNY